LKHSLQLSCKWHDFPHGKLIRPFPCKCVSSDTVKIKWYKFPQTYFHSLGSSFFFFFSFFFQKRLYSDWACKKLWLPSNTFDLTWLTSKEASTFISWSRVEFTRCYLELSFMLFISTLQVNRVKFFQRIAQWKKIFSKLT
jgi:hypothetical protein